MTVAVTRLVALAAATVTFEARGLLSVERFWLETTGDLSPQDAHGTGPGVRNGFDGRAERPGW